MKKEQPLVLEPGTRVRVRTTMVGKSIGVTPIPRRGGEGVVIGAKLCRRSKVLYTVTMSKDGRQRPVYSKDLVVLPKPRKRRRAKHGQG